MIDSVYYSSIFLYTVIILTLYALKGMNVQTFDEIKSGKNNLILAGAITVIFILWIGFRPVSGVFVDMVTYARMYQHMQGQVHAPVQEGGEFIWTRIMYACSRVMDVQEFFAIIATGYFGFSFWACRKLTPNNVLVTLLFIFGALSFFSYGTNGIRNGFACSIVILAMAYMLDKKLISLIIAGALALCASAIHTTTILPIAAAIVSAFLVRKFKYALAFWFFSILLSLAFGNTISAYFATLGFDNRLSYLTTFDENAFSRTGFRWDFLLYSMMPIILGYYVIIKHGIENSKYTILLNTYTLCNAFWIMVIRANYSNRFAYLSWFMYPIVLAYPLLEVDIWENEQGRHLKNIMLTHVGFTWVMQVIYW